MRCEWSPPRRSEGLLIGTEDTGILTRQEVQPDARGQHRGLAPSGRFRRPERHGFHPVTVTQAIFAVVSQSKLQPDSWSVGRVSRKRSKGGEMAPEALWAPACSHGRTGVGTDDRGRPQAFTDSTYWARGVYR